MTQPTAGDIAAARRALQDEAVVGYLDVIHLVPHGDPNGDTRAAFTDAISCWASHDDAMATEAYEHAVAWAYDVPTLAHYSGSDAFNRRVLARATQPDPRLVAAVEAEFGAPFTAACPVDEVAFVARILLAADAVDPLRQTDAFHAGQRLGPQEAQQ